MYTTSNKADEPPINPFLADSPWAATHRNSYCQASSPYPGPAVFSGAKQDRICGYPGGITVVVSPAYPDKKRVLWWADTRYVYKAMAEKSDLRLITRLEKENASLIPATADAITGAYTLIDRDGVFYVPRYHRIHAYGDSVKGDHESAIARLRVYEIPAAEKKGDREKIIGLTMTYDGYLVFVTDRSTVGAVSRDFARASYLRFRDPDEAVSNSIACDEDGGIYIVTSKKMHRVQWTGTELSLDESQGAWSAEYETGSDSGGIRLGEGSGSTPTLMGTGTQDRFVVITDGQELMHLVLFWRGRIPDDWKQLHGARDRRIAAQVPVTFGYPLATRSLSEQSVTVRGYGVAVVNNQLSWNIADRTLAMLSSGLSWIAPSGVEKFQWDPSSRTLKTSWANRTASFPNAIPCMSAATNMFYCIGQRNSRWTLEALDWSTGRSVGHYRFGCILGGFQYNSAYSATQIGPSGMLMNGCLGGLAALFPEE